MLRLAAPLSCVLAFWLAAGPPLQAAEPPRVVNVTTDSEPGWTPSVEQERGARATLSAFLAALDSGRAAEAYAMLGAANRRDRTEAGFVAENVKFRKLSGSVKDRVVLKTTWTKDGPRAPFPGVFVAIDLASRFDGIDRHCGYVVLYQAPAVTDFQVMRQQDAYIDNATADQIAKGGKPPGVDALWAELSASSCPNYKPPLPETDKSAIGYPTVAAALADLRARPGVVVSVRDGWTIVDVGADRAIWSFPPLGHPAYPSAVKRQVVDNVGQVSIQMNVLCHADKVACDDLVREFEALNKRTFQSR